MHPDKRPIRVLVVDDELLIRWSVTELLSEAGFDVVQAETAGDALRAVQDGSPDVVLLDFRLPDSEDLGLLAAIRKAAPQAQVILMTAFGATEVVAGALRLGAYRVVPKPFDMHDLVPLVRQADAARLPRPDDQR